MKWWHTNCDQDLTRQRSESTTTITGIIGSVRDRGSVCLVVSTNTFF